MPEKRTIHKAQRAKRQGKAPSTQAGAFVEQEMRHVKKGKHGARSRAQAIAIGLSEARRSGVAVPARGQAARKSRRGTKRGGRSRHHIHEPKTNRRRSRASEKALKRMGRPRLKARRKK